MKIRCKGIPLLVLGVLVQTARSNEFESQVSEFKSQSEATGPSFQKALGREARLVPIVLPISNPTIGVGLGGGVLYMHAKDADADPNEPSTMTGVFGMYTDTESWAVGGFHSGSYKDDSIRISVPVVHGDFSLKYYGVGENSPFRDDPIDYDAAGNLFTPKISFELPFESWFLGTTYRIIDIKTEFGNPAGDDEVPGYNARQKTAGFGLISLYDSRNSNLWPSKGNWFDFSALMNGQYAGGDYNYLKSTLKWVQYFQPLEPLILIYRLDGQFVEGEAPFWDLARIRLRGFSSGQYLDDVAATAQAELRWNAYRRWYLSLFGGAGWIGDSISDLGSADPNFAGGTGFRYMLVEDQKLSIGLDVAYTKDDTEFSIYFQIGDWLAN
jgi:hypothetical protein